jgi:hypothetical protein
MLKLLVLTKLYNFSHHNPDLYLTPYSPLKKLHSLIFVEERGVGSWELGV